LLKGIRVLATLNLAIDHKLHTFNVLSLKAYHQKVNTISDNRVCHLKTINYSTKNSCFLGNLSVR
jgi:hypothetical protein